MTRVDFYILDSADPGEALRYTCKLVEKAYRRGHSVFIQTDSAQQTEQLDTLLWDYRPEAFVPHGYDDAPVSIDHGVDTGTHHDVLINLKATVPTSFSRFHRLAEIVCQQPAWLTASRERYGFYKHRGYPLHTHRIKA